MRLEESADRASARESRLTPQLVFNIAVCIGLVAIAGGSFLAFGLAGMLLTVGSLIIVLSVYTAELQTRRS